MMEVSAAVSEMLYCRQSSTASEGRFRKVMTHNGSKSTLLLPLDQSQSCMNHHCSTFLAHHCSTFLAHYRSRTGVLPRDAFWLLSPRRAASALRWRSAGANRVSKLCLDLERSGAAVSRCALSRSCCSSRVNQRSREEIVRLFYTKSTKRH